MRGGQGDPSVQTQPSSWATGRSGQAWQPGPSSRRASCVGAGRTHWTENLTMETPGSTTPSLDAPTLPASRGLGTGHSTRTLGPAEHREKLGGVALQRGCRLCCPQLRRTAIRHMAQRPLSCPTVRPHCPRSNPGTWVFGVTEHTALAIVSIRVICNG